MTPTNRPDKGTPERLERLLALHHIAKAIHITLSERDILRVLGRELRKVMPVEQVTLVTTPLPAQGDDPAGTMSDRLDYTVLQADETVVSQPTSLPREGSAFDRVIAERQPQLIADLAQEATYPEDHQLLEENLRSCVRVPLIVPGSPAGEKPAAEENQPQAAGQDKERVLGALGFACQAPNAFDADDVTFLTLVAEHVAIAIQNARVYGKLQRSLTDLHEAQDRLLQTEKLSALGELISGVAHELNNPLSAVMGFAQLLRDSDTDPERRRDLDLIYQQAERSVHIVRNLLTFARQYPPERRLVDINEVLEGTLELLAYHLRVDNITVERDMDPQLPKVMADPHQLQQVFVNLITNAHQAMVSAHGRGTLTIRTRRRIAQPPEWPDAIAVGPGEESASEQPQPPHIGGQTGLDAHLYGDWVRVEIADDGPGIPPEIMSRIFDPFFTTKGREGTGLGLAICFGIIAEHNGAIWSQNRAEGGASFIVELPVPSEAEATEKPHRDEGSQRESPTAAEEALSLHLLVVEDEIPIGRLLARMLRRDGHRVNIANDGETALRYLREHAYDAILMDLKMPGMSGQVLYEEICKRYPELRRRVVFVTGDTVSAETAEFLERTGNPIVRKPFLAEQLRNALNAVL